MEVEQVINDIKQLEKEQKEAGRTAREKTKRIVEIQPKSFSGTIAAVDGGILTREFHTLDLVVTRAVSAVFSYNISKLISYSFYPSPLPPTEIYTKYALEKHEFIWFSNIIRLKKEIGCAIETIKKHAPHIMLLDGSIVPQVSDKPSKDSKIYDLYEQLLDEYRQLFELCIEKNCALAGVIKDSRGRMFLSLLEKENAIRDGSFISRSNDSSFLSFLLKKGERTTSFPYALNKEQHPILRDFSKWEISSFYLRPTQFDRPLRVDFLSNNADDEKLGEYLFELSKINRIYAYPAVLIEADLRAAMRPEEAEATYRDITAKIGPRVSIFQLRRNERPFR